MAGAEINDAAVDAVCQPDLLYQVTVSEQHGINTRGLASAATKLRSGPGDAKLIFAVPPDVFTHDFSKQTLKAIRGRPDLADLARSVKQYVIQIPGLSFVAGLLLLVTCQTATLVVERLLAKTGVTGTSEALWALEAGLHPLLWQETHIGAYPTTCIRQRILAYAECASESAFAEKYDPAVLVKIKVVQQPKVLASLKTKANRHFSKNARGNLKGAAVVRDAARQAYATMVDKSKDGSITLATLTSGGLCLPQNLALYSSSLSSLQA
ncbi:TPA: hypothetical protein ACH3X1_011680 [Trebouxia sp. C0004]